MKILVIEKNEGVADGIVKKLQEMGHEATWRSSKSVAIQLFESEKFDCVVLDPAPLSAPRPIVLDIRRYVGNYPYFLLMSDDLGALDQSEMSGVHDTMVKPIDPYVLEEKIANAARYNELLARMEDVSVDFPSAGGIISKSAFGQLFLSSVDRSDRYEEQTYFLFVAIKNYQEILEMDGAYAAEYSAAQLAQTLVKIRRQSDIVGQTAKNEFSVLMRGSDNKREPLDAANRFAQALLDSHMINESNIGPVEVSLTLLGIPKCMKMAEHSVVFERLG